MVITKIITSLPEEYKHFVSVWESVSDNQQTIAELTARLLVEKQRNKSRKEITDLSAKNGVNINKKKCFRCGKTGHFKKDCKTKQKFCEHCKKKGHEKNEFWFLKNKHEHHESKGKKSSAFTVPAVSALCGLNTNRSGEWIMDSGAT